MSVCFRVLSGAADGHGGLQPLGRGRGAQVAALGRGRSRHPRLALHLEEDGRRSGRRGALGFVSTSLSGLI